MCGCVCSDSVYCRIAFFDDCLLTVAYKIQV